MPTKTIPRSMAVKHMKEDLKNAEEALVEDDKLITAKDKEIKDYRKMLKTVAECVRVPGGLVDDIETLLKKIQLMKGCRNTAIFVPIIVTIFVLIVHYGCGCRGKEREENVTKIKFKTGSFPSKPDTGFYYYQTTDCSEIYIAGYGDTIAVRRTGKWVIKDSMKAIENMYQAIKQWTDQLQKPFVLIDDTKRDTFRYYNRDTIHINVRTQFEQVTF